jgi:hypothetical protein
MMIFDIPTTAAAVMFAMAAVALAPVLRPLKRDPDDAPLTTRVDAQGIAHREEPAEIEHFEAAIRELGGHISPEPKLSDFAKKRRTLPEPPPAPAPLVKFDRIAALKLEIRQLTYGEMMEWVEGELKAQGIESPTAEQLKVAADAKHKWALTA